MNINSINGIQYSNLQNYKCNNRLHYAKYSALTKDTLSFGQSAKIPPKVLKYLKQVNEKHLIFYDIEKLEGLQNGIEIFKGLSFPQIYYLISKLNGVITKRGCINNCIHCFADAKPPFYMKSHHLIDKIDFEDYENFCNGFKELNQRLGFTAFEQTFIDSPETKALFYDSDSSMIYLQDKNGKTYDYADLSKMMHEATGNLVLFDTAGWNINDKITQKRMEDLVNKVSNTDEYNFIQFFISINPFHSIYNKSVEFAANGDKANSKKFREIYVDRMANVLYTMSPLLPKKNSCKEPQLRFIARVLPNNLYTSGYMYNDLLKLFKDIINKLKNLYDNDIRSTNPKIVKNIWQKNKYLELCSELFKTDNNVSLSNTKLVNKLKEKDEFNNYWRKVINIHLKDDPDNAKHFRFGFIDLDGRFYMTNYYETYPTNIVLNYKNKGLPTAKMGSNLVDKMIMVD